MTKRSAAAVVEPDTFDDTATDVIPVAEEQAPPPPDGALAAEAPHPTAGAAAAAGVSDFNLMCLRIEHAGGQSIEVNIGMLVHSAELRQLALAALAERQQAARELARARKQRWRGQSMAYRQYVRLRNQLAANREKVGAAMSEVERLDGETLAATRNGEDPTGLRSEADRHRAEAERLKRWNEDLDRTIREAGQTARQELVQLAESARAHVAGDADAEAQRRKRAALAALLDAAPAIWAAQTMISEAGQLRGEFGSLD